MQPHSIESYCSVLLNVVLISSTHIFLLFAIKGWWSVLSLVQPERKWGHMNSVVSNLGTAYHFLSTARLVLCPQRSSAMLNWNHLCPGYYSQCSRGHCESWGTNFRVDETLCVHGTVWLPSAHVTPCGFWDSTCRGLGVSTSHSWKSAIMLKVRVLWEGHMGRGCGERQMPGQCPGSLATRGEIKDIRVRTLSQIFQPQLIPCGAEIPASWAQSGLQNPEM